MCLELLTVSYSARKTTLKVGPGVNAEGQRGVMVKAYLDARRAQRVASLYLLEGLGEVGASAAPLPRLISRLELSAASSSQF